MFIGLVTLSRFRFPVEVGDGRWETRARCWIQDAGYERSRWAAFSAFRCFGERDERDERVWRQAPRSGALWITTCGQPGGRSWFHNLGFGRRNRSDQGGAGVLAPR